MKTIASAALALALSAAGLLAGALPSEAAGAVPSVGVGQHQAVVGNIANAQRRNAAAISHVQNNIRSTQRNRF